MNERIRELAEQAGVIFDTDPTYTYGASPKVLQRFAELVRQDLYQEIGKGVITQINGAVLMEREACAKLCEELSKRWYDEGGSAIDCASAIRARGEK